MASPLEGTRLKLLAIIRERGSASVDQLAQDTNLAPPTIRRHLDILQRDHLVYYQQSHKQQGRPEYQYSLTEKGHESGHRDYEKLLNLLITNIKELPASDLAGIDGNHLLALLMSRISHGIIESYTPPDSSLSKNQRVAKLEQVLTDSGYEPRIERSDGHVEISLCNCPFRAAALCEESVCLSDQYLIASVLAAEPVRQSSIRNGDLCCTYLVELDN